MLEFSLEAASFSIWIFLIHNYSQKIILQRQYLN